MPAARTYPLDGKYTSRNATPVIAMTEAERPRRAVDCIRLRSIFEVLRSTTQPMGNCSILSGTAYEIPLCRAGRCRIKTFGDSLFSFGIYPKSRHYPL